MTNEELELIKQTELLDKDIAFCNELNRKYDELCFHVRKKKGYFNYYLGDILDFVCGHWEDVDKLPKEDMYMVLNVLKLARNVNMGMYWEYYESEKFQKMCENYTNSR